jgi:UDP-glucose 4-epimerase
VRVYATGDPTFNSEDSNALSSKVAKHTWAGIDDSGDIAGDVVSTTILFVRVLVTGGAGFIGSHLVRSLCSEMEIRVLDDLSSGLRENLLGINVELIEGSILDIDTLEASADGCDAIVHLAARPSVPRSILDPVATHHVNTTGTVNVLQVARKLKDPLVIVASSSSVYGANPALPKSESLTPMPMSPYAVSKLTAEQYVLAAQYSFGVRTLAFRFFNVYGPRQSPTHDYAAVVPKFLFNALQHQPLEIFGDGSQTRDFTYVSTVCSAIRESLVKSISSKQPVNLAFGTRTSLLDLVRIVEDILQRKVEVRHYPTRVGDVQHSQADGSLLRRLLPSIEEWSLHDGVRETANWMENWINRDK